MASLEALRGSSIRIAMDGFRWRPESEAVAQLPAAPRLDEAAAGLPIVAELC